MDCTEHDDEQFLRDWVDWMRYTKIIPTMRCCTCQQATSTVLPVDPICRQCHEYSMWCKAVPQDSGDGMDD
jgi:hypothetical protein